MRRAACALLLATVLAGCFGLGGRPLSGPACTDRADWVVSVPQPSGAAFSHYGQRLAADGGHVVLQRAAWGPGVHLWGFDAAGGRRLWERSFPGLVQVGPFALADGLLFVGMGTAGDTPASGYGPLSAKLVALDAATGAPLWEVATQLPASDLFLARGVLVVATGWEVKGLGPGNATVLWSVPAPEPTLRNFGGAVLAGDRVAAWSDDGTLLAIDPANGKAAWNSSLAEGFSSRPVAVTSDAVVLRGEGGRLRAFGVADGEPEWTTGPNLSNRFLADGGTLYLADVHGNVTALDLGSGRERWTQVVQPTTEWTDWGSRQVADAPRLARAGGGVLALAWQWGKPEFFNPTPVEAQMSRFGAEGGLAWRHEGGIGSTVVLDGGPLVLQGGSRFESFDPSTGGSLWQCAFDDPPQGGSPDAIAAGAVYAAGQDHLLRMRAAP